MGPRIVVKAMTSVQAATPEELCNLVTPMLGKDDKSWEIHGLPQYCSDCKKWTQFLVQTALVVPRELLEQMQAAAPRVVPVSGNIVQR